MSVARFLARLEIARSTWHYRRAAHLEGRPIRYWPTPVVDVTAPAAAEQAHTWSAWGHRKTWAMLRADGVHVSQSSVYRALSRRDLLQPVRYQAEQRALAAAPKIAFVAPPLDATGSGEPTSPTSKPPPGSTRWIASVADYDAKVVLDAQLSSRIAGRDAISSTEAAIQATENAIGHSLLEDCTDKTTAQITPVVIATDIHAGRSAFEQVRR